MSLGTILILCLIWYLISFTYSVLAIQHSITYHKYKFDSQTEQFIVSCMVVLLCWTFIIAEVVYHWVKGEDENSTSIDSNFVKKNKTEK